MVPRDRYGETSCSLAVSLAAADIYPAAGGNIEKDWPITRIFAVADEAVGVPVLTELYGQMGAAPLAVDLPALWSRLGVAVRDGAVHFDDQAPQAAVRAAITGDP